MPDLFTIDIYGKESEIIENIESGSWIERYLKGGEFKITSYDEKILSKLQIGALLTHTGTHEVMEVETHDVTEKRGEAPVIEISGRTLEETLLERRLLTRRAPGAIFYQDKIANPGKGYIANDVIADWLLAKIMIQDYVINGIEHPAQIVPNIAVDTEYEYYILTSQARDYNWSNLETVYSAIQEILAQDDLGFKTRRPSFLQSTMDFVIYKGTSKGLVLSWDLGQLEDARYLWSSRGELTAMVMYDGDRTSRHYTSNGSGLSCKEGKFDMSYLDVDWDAYAPNDASINSWVHTRHRRRALEEIRKNHKVKMIDAKIADDTSLRYNVDYAMGDLVQVIGRYGFRETLRVTEYALTWDENGIKTFPTMSELPDTSISFV